MTLATALTALVVSGCSATPAETGSQPGSGTGANDGALDTELGSLRYVAMGDSYTAAPLKPLRERTVIDDCLRSASNYPALVADETGYELLDVSCSGASTVSMFNPQRFVETEQPPQLDALDADTDVVTVGIGANDFRFFSEMIFSCLRLARTDTEGAPCQEANRTRQGRDRLETDLVEIRDNVERVVTEIGERAPNARILMIGYPQLLPSEGTCRLRLPLAEGDYPYALSLNLALAAAVRDGGTAAGAEYVDLVEASQGHDICAENPWVAGIRGKNGFAAGLHPYPSEQRAVADLVLGML